jgi:hypothetical protein
MTTLSGDFLRLTAVCTLVLALAALCPTAARAQSADADSVTSKDVDSDQNQPADTDGGSNSPAAASSTDSGRPASLPAAKPDSATGPSATGSGSAQGLKSDSSVPSGSSSSEGYTMHAALKSFDTPPPTGDRLFDRAAEAFPDFCRDWQRKLHDRELNNLENVTWKDQNGWKTGTYLAYSPVKTCNTKRSTGGIPIGELTYQETEYYLSGRTVEEARHSQPKPVGITNTTEIFRWDKSKWDDGQ